MDLICERKPLAEALTLIAGVAPSRTPQKALGCVKLAAGADPAGVTLTATDGERYVSLTLHRVDVSKPGEALIPADKLRQITHEAGGATLRLKAGRDHTLEIGGEAERYELYGTDPDALPPMPHDVTLAADIRADALRTLLTQTLFATAKDNSRYAINGVLLARDGDQLVAMATDGHRLAKAQVHAEFCEFPEHQVVVPAPALRTLTGLLDDPEAQVGVLVNEQTIRFDVGTTGRLHSLLIEGSFPPYQDVIPKDNDKQATMAAEDLTRAVRQAALLTNEESKAVRLAVGSGGLRLSSRAPEMGEARIHVEVARYEGEPIEIGFNPHYLLDALKVLDESQVQLAFKAANKPGVLRAGDHWLYVLMPVNLQSKGRS